MPLSPLAGLPAPRDMLIDVDALIREYHERAPDLSSPAERVAFGTSGHRGTPRNGSFTEAHILAITQAICEYRASEKIDGPLFFGFDTHALSAPAQETALSVLAANNVQTVIQEKGRPTPTPVISREILVHNRGRTTGLADGIIVTPSHNPPEDGGFKYNPPHGGPADSDVTRLIQDRANALLASGNREVRRTATFAPGENANIIARDFVRPYVDDLKNVVDMEAIRSATLRIGVDPLGGAAIGYWGPIAETYELNINIANSRVDPAFSFMCVDHDGKIRMDCSSPYAMAGLIGLIKDYDLAFGNDPDADRHGIVTTSMGLMNPNHYLAVAIEYLFSNRPDWRPDAAIGKTLVSSSLIDRVAALLGRRLAEVPVGFKWFVPGLLDGSLGFGGEESAGLSFLRRDGSPWSTDKDGLIACLLAAEIMAVTGDDPGTRYQKLAARVGTPHYARIDEPATPEEKTLLKKLSPQAVSATLLAGEEIVQKLTRAPANDAPIDGLKVVTKNGWFAARPSGTENIYKVYAESFRGEEHLRQILTEAGQIVGRSLGRAVPAVGPT